MVRRRHGWSSSTDGWRRGYWPGENPIGKLVRARSWESGPHGEPAPWLTVVGVVGDVRTWGLDADPRPEMYLSYLQTPPQTFVMTAAVRAGVPAATLLKELERRARLIDPHVPIALSTLDARLHAGLARRELTMSLLAGFAAIALLLAALGVYGVMSYAVALRTRELAVRAALGAQRAQLLGLVLLSGLRVIAIGGLIGIVGSFALTRTIRSMLVDITATDPMTYAAACAVLLTVALAAIVIPAYRATRSDPGLVLRSD